MFYIAQEVFDEKYKTSPMVFPMDYVIITKYSRFSLSRPRLSRTTAYLEVKIWSLF